MILILKRKTLEDENKVIDEVIKNKCERELHVEEKIAVISI